MLGASGNPKYSSRIARVADVGKRVGTTIYRGVGTSFSPPLDE